MAKKSPMILAVTLINITGLSLSLELGNKWFSMVSCPKFFPGYNTSFINMTVNTIYNCLYQAKNKPTTKSLVFHKDSQTGQNTCFLYEDIASSCEESVEGDFGSNKYLFKPKNCENGGSLTNDKLKCDCPVGYIGPSCNVSSTDCKDLFDRGISMQRRIHSVNLLPNRPPINLTCKYGSTIVMYQDINYDANFNLNRSWAEYRDGFYGQENFWLGLEIMNFLTTEKFRNGLVVKAKINADGKEKVLQTNFIGFKVDNENTDFTMSYRETIPVSNYLGELLKPLNNSRFSTYDNDNDNRPINCAVKYGGGWWYNTSGTFTRESDQGSFDYECAPANPTGYFASQCESCSTEVKDISTGNVINGVVQMVEMYIYTTE